MWNCGLYIRLSKEDKNKFESESVLNQKKILEKFIKENEDLSLTDYYIDDGYSGTSFNRPEVTRLFKDIKNNKVNCVIVKDLSRFGRNYLEVGNYLENIFPLKNIRFISINDYIDSYNEPNGYNSISLPFKNLINDEYSKDISKKVRSSLNIKRSEGKFIGASATYGYLKNNNDLIIDPMASKIVIEIFDLYIKGYSMTSIATILNKKNILPPLQYKQTQGILNYNEIIKNSKWDYIKVSRILKNQIYIGTLIQGKHKKISYKVKNTIPVPKENWYISNNNHKPIIPLDKFNKVQQLLNNKNTTYTNKTYLFSNLLYCKECNNTFTPYTYKGDTYYYCKTYKQKGKSFCTNHKTKEIHLLNIVKTIINNIAVQNVKFSKTTIEHYINKIVIDENNEIKVLLNDTLAPPNEWPVK